MSLSNQIISEFAKLAMAKKETKPETVVQGTVKYDGKLYVKLDGSDLLTPVDTTIDVADGDRVNVTIKDHTATITGSTSSPAAKKSTVEKQGSQISEFEIIVAYKVTADNIAATNAIIDKLLAKVVNVTELSAVVAEIETLKATLVNADRLTATDIEAINAQIDKLSANIIDATGITTEELKADYAEIDELKAYVGDFTYIIADELEAINANIKNLKVDKLSANEADLKYANIDFSNIGKATMEYFYAQSGLIRDVVVGDQTITGELVGVTIRGDRIIGNTIVADKLVIRGEDGLFYKLNTGGGNSSASGVLGEGVLGEMVLGAESTGTGSEILEEDQNEYNSLSGKVIMAKSITATKIAVDDLVAFDATIGGFNITKNSIYSGVKETVNNTTRGIYLDNDGQIAFGDSSSYIKFFKDTDGAYKLDISASAMRFSSSSKTVEEEIEEIKTTTDSGVKDIVVQYALGSSTTTVPTSGWSETAPEWTSGKYMWQRVVTTYNNGTTVEGNPTCISGAKGEDGTSGQNGQDAPQIVYEYALSYSSTIPPESQSIRKLGTPVIYLDGIDKLGTPEIYLSEDSSTSAVLGEAVLGEMVLGNGSTEEASVMTLSVEKLDTPVIELVELNSKLDTPVIRLVDDVIVGEWSTTVPQRGEGQYIWQRIKYIYPDGGMIIYDPICITGEQGAQGLQGDKGDKGDSGVGIKSVTEYYAVSSSNTETPIEWKDYIPELTSTDKYLWNYEETTYTDDTVTETVPGVIGVFGNDGKGVEEIVEYYALSKVSYEVPGEWSNDIPTLTNTYKYLWNYEKIRFSDGSESTTDPIIIGTYGDTGSSGRDAITYRIESSLGSVFLNTQDDTTVLTAKIYKGSAELDSDGAYGYTWYLVEKDGTERVIGNGKTLSILTSTIAGKGVYFIADDGGVEDEMVQLDTPVIELVEVLTQLETPVIYIEEG